MEVRRYRTEDREACLRILDSNVPEYFVAGDRAEVSAFLDDLEKLGVRYFVVESEDGAILACGGVGVDDATKEARLCWGMVARAHHREGLGRILLAHRLREAKAMGATTARLSTISKVEGFFAREGFAFASGEDDGFGPGMHRRDYRITL